MKKHLLCLTFFLFLLTGCGKQESSQQEYYDFVVTSEQIIEERTEGFTYQYLGAQYYEGEPVWLWADYGEGVKERVNSEIWMLRGDGSEELLLSDVPTSYTHLSTGWWLDGDRYYVKLFNGFAVLDEEGNEISSVKTDGNIYSFCRLQNGNLLLFGNFNGKMMLATLDENTEKLEEKAALNDSSFSLLAGTDTDVFALGLWGFYKVDLETGEMKYLFRWEGHSYTWVNSQDTGAMQVNEDGSINLLWKDGHEETLKLEKIEGRTSIILRTLHAPNWLRAQVQQFNQSSDTYFVVLEEANMEGDLSDWQNFRERTDMEIAAGRGADLVFDDGVNDLHSLLSKGALEDLRPYLEQSEMNRADYFDPIFSCWNEGEEVFGVDLVMHLRSIWISEDVFKGVKDPDVETLVNLLLSYDREAVFMEDYDSAWVVQYFLEASEDLWGMVDWKNGTCDFSGELFSKILDVGKRYGDSESNNAPALAGWMYLYHSFSFDGYSLYYDVIQDPQEHVEELGYFFDDGNHPFLITEVLAMNSHSHNKEGAWEFIAFLLSEETQRDLYEKYGGMPVNRAAYTFVAEQELVRWDELRARSGWYQMFLMASDPGGREFITQDGLTEEKLEHMTRDMEESRPLPIKTEPILAIIDEEIQTYYAGTKTKDEVIAVIENRVQLYLDEQR